MNNPSPRPWWPPTHPGIKIQVCVSRSILYVSRSNLHHSTRVNFLVPCPSESAPLARFLRFTAAFPLPRVFCLYYLRRYSLCFTVLAGLGRLTRKIRFLSRNLDYFSSIIRSYTSGPRTKNEKRNTINGSLRTSSSTLFE